MTMNSVFCHVRHAHVAVVTDLEGHLTQLVCPEYEPSIGLCRIRARAKDGGPLSQLLERLDEETLDQPAERCYLVS